MSAVIKTKEQLVEKVLSDYMQESVELCSGYFDFQVNMVGNDIMDAFAELQEKINGDKVLYPRTNTYRFEGNCMDYINSFNGVEGYERYVEGTEEKTMFFF